MHLRHCCNNELWLLLKSITGLSDCGLCCTHCRVQLKFNLVELWTLGAPSGVLGGALLGAAKKKKKNLSGVVQTIGNNGFQSGEGMLLHSV